jgi:hypothetical protein
MTRGALVLGATAALAIGALTPALARPQYLNTFKSHYNTASGKPKLNAANCGMCHVGMPREARFNPYGDAVRAALGAPNVQDQAKIKAAFDAAASKQNPATRVSFADMINGDVLPASNQAPAGTASTAAGGGGGGALSGTWEPLFNGLSMNGLTKENAGNFEIKNGILRYTGGGNGWLRSNKEYTNYSLVMVWRYPNPGNNDAGLFLKARPGDKGNPWPRSPQLNMGPGDNLGSLLGKPARPDLIKKNDWNTYQVTVVDGVATLAINGQVAWDMVSNDALKGPGHVGVQVENWPLDIAGLWVMPLP